jgi:DNA polymerase-3 subunit delta
LAPIQAGREKKDDSVRPCYAFYGDETFLAEEFVRELKKRLISEEDQGFNLETFHLAETKWREIIDLARTIPFFFSPWRVIIVRTDNGPKERLSAADENLLADYFASPSPRTVLVILMAGKVEKSHPLLKFLSSLPQAVVALKEMMPLKKQDLERWMERQFAEAGKKVLPDALRRLSEIAGNDLRRLAGEIDKLAAFAADKSVIDPDDIDQISDWTKTFPHWELTNSLEKGDLKNCLVVLDNLFREGTDPGYILGTIGGLFRDLLTAKVWLREKSKDKKEIFRALRPRIQEKWAGLYREKFEEFFSLAEGMPQAELSRELRELEQIDLKLKSSDSLPQPLLEAFLSAYCSRRKKPLRGRAIWKGRS